MDGLCLFDRLALALGEVTVNNKYEMSTSDHPVSNGRLIGYGIAGNRVTHHIPCTSRACRITAFCFGLEHPRPHVLRLHRLSSPSAREPANYRQGKSTAGETSLVRNPVYL